MAKKPSDILKDYAKAVQMVDPSKFDFLLEEIPKIIRVRTRLGKGLDGKLKPLSKAYIERRRKIEDLSPSTKANKSNLTLTGEMLDSIKAIRNGYRVTVSFSNSDADKKAFYAREGGRPFFGLLQTEKNGLQRKISAIIRETIRQLFKS